MPPIESRACDADGDPQTAWRSWACRRPIRCNPGTMARDYKPKRKRPGSRFSGWIGVAAAWPPALAIAAAIYVKDHGPMPGHQDGRKIRKKKARIGDPSDADNAEAGRVRRLVGSRTRFYDISQVRSCGALEKDKDVRPDHRPRYPARPAAAPMSLQAGSYKNCPQTPAGSREASRCRASKSRFKMWSVDNEPGTGSASGPISNLGRSSTPGLRSAKADVDV